jgi:hypothetical protein
MEDGGMDPGFFFIFIRTVHSCKETQYQFFFTGTVQGTMLNFRHAVRIQYSLLKEGFNINFSFFQHFNSDPSVPEDWDATITWLFLILSLLNVRTGQVLIFALFFLHTRVPT